MNTKSIIFKTSLIIGLTITIFLVFLGLFVVTSQNSLLDNIEQSNIENMEKTLEDRKNSELQSVQEYLDFVAKTIGNVSAEYIYNVDEDGLKLQLKNFVNIKELMGVDVIDKTANKTFVAAWSANGEISYGTELPESITNNDYKTIKVASMYQEDEAGEVIVYYTDRFVLEKINTIRENIISDFEVKKQAIQEKQDAAIALQTLIMLAIILALVVATVLLLSRMVKKPLSILKSAMVELAENKSGGDADYIDIFRDDEIGEVAKYFNRYITKIVYGSEVDGTLIGDAVEVVEKVKAGHLRNRLSEDRQNAAMYKLQTVVNDMLENLHKNTQDILSTLNSYANDDFTRRTDTKNIEGEVKELIDGVNLLGGALSKMLTTNLKNGLSLEEDSKNLRESAGQLGETFNKQSEMLLHTTDQLSKMTDELQSNGMKIDAMTTHANDMKAIIGIIGDIADQTNLLALNAAIEAARAGEHGRGFAVVSDEVRKLAEKTQKSLSEINVSINGLIQSVEEVAETFKEQATGIEEINETISNVDSMTQSSTESTDRVTQISIDISDMADTLVKDSKSKKFNMDESVNVSRSAKTGAIGAETEDTNSNQ